MSSAFDYMAGGVALALLCLLLPPQAVANPAPLEAPGDLQDPESRATLRIQSRVDQARWRKSRAVEIRHDQSVQLRLDPDLDVENAEVRWYLVFADITREYQNANKPWEEDPGKWTGYDEIQYYRVELTELRNQAQVAPFAHVDDVWATVRERLSEEGEVQQSVRWYADGLGTFWFQAEVERDGDIQRSPGLQDVGRKGLSRKVLRVSIRQDDTYLGHLRSFHNVPSVFGSTTWQSRNHVAVDCADVLMAAWHDWKGKRMKKNVNVAMVAKTFDERATTRIEDGAATDALRWGEDLEPGDLIAVQYDAEWSTRYNHIGALAGDTDGDGVLSAGDVVLHAGPAPLHESLLSSGAFDGSVIVVRPE